MRRVSRHDSRQSRTGLRLALPASCAAVALLAFAVSAAPAAAGPKEQAAPADSHYQVYIGGRDTGSYMLNQDWGELRAGPPNGGGSIYAPSLTGAPDSAGMTYFTPSVSGVRVGVGFGATPQTPAPDAAQAGQYTDLGPRTAQGHDAAGRWQVGGTVSYSALELGANIGDHADPSCTSGGCKTNDFWDVGVALRSPSTDPRARASLEEARAITETTLQSVRDMSQLLHPSMLDDFGLPETLAAYLHIFSKPTGRRRQPQLLILDVHRRRAPLVVTLLDPFDQFVKLHPLPHHVT